MLRQSKLEEEYVRYLEGLVISLRARQFREEQIQAPPPKIPERQQQEFDNRRQQRLREREVRREREQRHYYVPTDRTVEHRRNHNGEHPNEAMVEYLKSQDELCEGFE